MTNVRLLFFAAVFASTGVAFAHGDMNESAWGHRGQAKDVARTVTITADEYQFSPSTLTFKAGETVKFVIKNSGSHKHEFTVGDAAEQAAHRQSMAAMSDMKHDEGTHEMPANSMHVAPGKTGELIWTFTRAGKLQFACNYPGHADLGMEGEITVQ